MAVLVAAAVQSKPVAESRPLWIQSGLDQELLLGDGLQAKNLATLVKKSAGDDADSDWWAFKDPEIPPNLVIKEKPKANDHDEDDDNSDDDR